MYPWKGILNPRPFTDRLPVQLSLELFFHFVPSGCFISVWLWVRPAPSGGPQDNKRNIPIRGHTTKEQPHFARLFLAECRKSFWRLQRQRAPLCKGGSHGLAVTGGLCGTMCEFARTPAKREHSAASIPPSRLRLPTSLCTSEALARCLFISFYPEAYFLDSLKGTASFCEAVPCFFIN